MIKSQGALMNGISALVKEAPYDSLASYTVRFYSEKIAIYKPESRPSPDPKSARALILDFSVSRTI